MQQELAYELNDLPLEVPRDWHGRRMKVPLIQRFFESIELKPVGLITDCWNWLRSKSYSGYGQMSTNGTMMRPHRFSYELFIGEIPKGLTIDHLCRNRLCVNPDHLEAVSQDVNYRRGEGNHKKTHCPKGHPLSGNNLKIHRKNTSPRRVCGECARVKSLEKYYARKSN